MASFVPIVIGALFALCLANVLACAGAATQDGRPLGGWRIQDIEARVRATARAVGAAVPEQLARSAAVDRCVGELARLSYDCSTRLGLLILADAACGLLCGIVALSPFGVVVGLCAPWVFLSMRAARRARAEERRVEAEMPEAFAALAIALGSGHSLAQGMRFVGSHAQEPVKTEFTRVSFAIECGIPAASALDELLERMPAPGLGLVSLALKVSQRTGASLRGLLAEAADMVGERIELARRLDVKTSQARMSARVVALMPAAMVALLTLLSADFRAGLSTPVGVGSVAVAFGLNMLAWGIIRRLMEVDIQ